MIRTYNRQPVSVNTPDEKNIREYFTNQMEWKGLNDDKNFVTVDQNSYQDCNNVYVDAEGLLRSRPAIKKIADDVAANVIEYYAFANCSVYRIVESNSEYYSFVSDVGGDTLNVAHGAEYKLVEANNKIYVIGEDVFAYYDTNTFTVVEDATGDIYIPEHEIYTDGVQTSSGESPNLLTDSYYKTYIYTGIGDPNYALFLGKNIEIKLDGAKYDIYNFTENTNLTFLSKMVTISRNNIVRPTDDDGPIGVIKVDYPLVSFSSLGSMIVSNYVVTFDPLDGLPIVHWDIYYSATGKVFTKLPVLDNMLGAPTISYDGAYVMCLTKDGTYIISVLKNYLNVDTDQVEYKYPNWKRLDALSDTNDGRNVKPGFKQNVNIAMSVIDDENYVIAYGTGGGTQHSNLKVVAKNGGALRTYTFDTTTSTTITHQYITSNRRFKLFIKQNNDKIDANVFYRPGGRDDYVVQIGLSIGSTINNYYVHEFEGTIDGLAAAYVADGFLTVDVDTTTNKTYASIVKVDGNNVTEAIKTANFALCSSLVVDSNCYLHTDNGIYTTASWFDVRHLLDGYTDEYRLSYLTGDVQPITAINKLYYLHNNDILTVTNEFTIKVYVNNGYNLIAFDKVAKLDDFFVAIGNRTYVNKPTGEDFKWYLPLDSENIFDSKITNLHPISSTEIAVFLKDAIYYTLWDSDLKTYRYMKSKIQVGCREGCDVITTFDGKYVIFTSARGLVAMNYQDFVATTDQTLMYISDTIYQLFYDYIVEPQSHVKLYKFGYWLIVYKNNSLKGFIFDLRNNTWWPFTSFKYIETIVTENDKPKLLIGTALHKLDVGDTDYYDFDGFTKYEIDWFLLSQKLYLGALNYYKHIVNLTFESVHDVTSLEQNDYNINELDFKLQVNNYRKTINGTVDTDNYDTVNYVVNAARTFVQRVNYSKVNEFQYKLSYDPESVFHLPLSLAAMSVKYKVGGKIR